MTKERTILRTLNHFKNCGQLLTGLVWVPKKYEQDFIAKKAEMQNLNPHIQSRDVDAELTRPTYFENNDFTSVFQQIIDTYGVPNYKEANPAVFSCVTFPFLFGVMFGDVMHGSMLLGAGIYLCLARPTKGSLVEMAAPLRYFAVLMGIFSLFCGFCYNEYTSIPLYVFGESCWSYTEGNTAPTLAADCVYPVGVDPSWYLGPNELTFMNSMKMKMSVIFGVAQMSLGILLKGGNAIYTRSALDFVFEFLPQIVVLLALFGFMDFMIITKWLTDFSGAVQYAPSIITVMIDMCLNGGEPSTPTDLPLLGTMAQQTELMNILMLVVLTCVPLMLCVKPIVISLTHKSSVSHEDNPSE